MRLVGRATALALVAGVLAASPGSGQTDEPAAPGRSADPGIRDRAAGAVAISKEPATGRVGFVRARGVDGDLLPGRPADSAGAAAAKATRYLEEYGPAFGATDGRLEQAGVTSTPHGWVVRFEQTYQGLSVFGAELKASVDRSGDLTAVSGYAAPGLSVDTTPRFSAARAGERAVAVVRAYPPGPHGGRATDVSGIHAVDPELMVYRVGATRGEPGEAILTWSVEVTNGRNIRDRVFLDADSGKPVNRYSMIDTALQRRLSEGTAGNVIWREGEDRSGLDAEQLNIVESTGDAYWLFRNTFGRDSYDGGGASMRSVADHAGNEADCPNAFWDGRTTNFCDDVASDDIVAHEWAHAYTEHTSDLVYQWQPGAMNEAYSDIWGETVDQINGRDDEGETPDDKWIIGEQSSGLPRIRDMYQPTTCGDPGRVRDADYYHCAGSDSGGVHTNSGVVNHAYALLVEGGHYRGRTIGSIGLDRAAHLFWRAQTAHLTSTSDFGDLADALEASCTELSGHSVTGLSVEPEAADPGGIVVRRRNCEQVDRVIAAVQLRREPTQCDFKPLLRKNPPSACGRRYRTVTTWQEGFDDRLRGWHQDSAARYRDGRGIRWRAAHAPRHRGRTAYARDPNADCSADVTSRNSLISPRVAVPRGRTPRLIFQHYVATERGYDGGLVRIKVNRGRWRTVPRRAYRYNGPNTRLKYGGISTNPLSGYRAWTGTDQGEVTGSWGQTQVNLGALGVRRGDRIRMRFDFGRDQCGGLDGWYVDDVRLVVCRPKHAGREARG